MSRTHPGMGDRTCFSTRTTFSSLALPKRWSSAACSSAAKYTGRAGGATKTGTQTAPPRPRHRGQAPGARVAAERPRITSLNLSQTMFVVVSLSPPPAPLAVAVGGHRGRQATTSTPATGTVSHSVLACLDTTATAVTSTTQALTSKTRASGSALVRKY